MVAFQGIWATLELNIILRVLVDSGKKKGEN